MVVLEYNTTSVSGNVSGMYLWKYNIFDNIVFIGFDQNEGGTFFQNKSFHKTKSIKSHF